MSKTLTQEQERQYMTEEQLFLSMRKFVLTEVAKVVLAMPDALVKQWEEACRRAA